MCVYLPYKRQSFINKLAMEIQLRHFRAVMRAGNMMDFITDH